MGGEFKTFSIEECMEAIIDYRGKTPNKTNSGIPLVTAKVIKNGRIERLDEFIAESEYETWMRRGMPKPGDVVLTSEAPLGEVAQLGSSKVALAQRVITLRGKPGLLDNTFLRFLLQSSEVQDELKSRGTGTTVVGIKQSELRKVQLRLPPVSIQRAIAHILCTLDDKIELNRRMNATLESVARALFQSWFVDFDPVRAKMDSRQPTGMAAATAVLFPDSFEESELGLIPTGWCVMLSASLIEVKDGTHDSPKPVAAGNPLITSKHIVGDSLDIASAYLISEEDFREINRRSKVDFLDNLMTMIGTVGVPFLVQEQSPDFAIKNIALFKTSQSPALAFYLYEYFCSAGMQHYLECRLAGTTQKFLSLGELRKLPILMPSSSVLKAFNNQVSTVYLNKHENLKQIAVLATLRDTLLPKLLSGALSVKHAEKLVGEST